MPGIIQPLLQHRWKLSIQSVNHDQLSHIISNIPRVLVDYVSKTATLEVEENIRGDVSDAVYDLVQRNRFAFAVDAIDGNDNISFSNKFIGANIISHSVKYDYANSAAVTHNLVISFDNMQLFVNNLLHKH